MNKYSAILIGLSAAVILVAYLVYLRVAYSSGLAVPKWITWAFGYPLSRFQWYRKWYGGRWEYWYIELCYSFVWIRRDPGHYYPTHYPCSGRGTPIIEDWPFR